MKDIMNSEAAIEFKILAYLMSCENREEELGGDVLGEHFRKLSQTVGFKEALTAPSLSKITAQKGGAFTEKLLGAILLHCWPKSIAKISWYEKQLFVRYLLKCHSTESAKDVLLAGTYAGHYKVRRSSTAGYLIELFKEYMNSRAGYVERFYERRKRIYNHELEDNVQTLIRQCPTLQPVVENFYETHLTKPK